jgi:hypothetical protein
MLRGLAVIVYSMLTRYEWGLLPIIRMPVHIGLDVGGGLLLAVSPWLFGFADVVWVRQLVFGRLEIGELAVEQSWIEPVVCTRRESFHQNIAGHLEVHEDHPNVASGQGVAICGL